MNDKRIHVYLMPGLAANPSIFKNIDLPTDLFEQHLLEWFVPKENMTISEYAAEMNKQVNHTNPVLLGVSFGGILVQEMAKLMKVHKVIVVSSVKMKSELPKRMIFSRYTKLHKLLPTGLVNNVELLAKYAFGETITKRLKLYEEYLSIRDKYYLDWSIDQMINWQQTECQENVIHIHGDKDAVFPVAHIKDYIPVLNGTHTMIIHRAKWFNENLPTIILD